MRIGIYGASFDPITNVHLWTASTVAHRCKLDKVIFVPASASRVDKEIFASDEDRFMMVLNAIAGNPKFEVDAFDINQLKWESYTYNTMAHFHHQYPDDELFFIMGADLLLTLPTWQRAEALIRENKFIVMARNGINMTEAIARSVLLRNYDDGSKFHLIDKGLAMELSSTYIRDEFRLGGEPRYLIPDIIYDYIVKHKLYGAGKDVVTPGLNHI